MGHKGKALGAPLYQLFGGKAREHIELYPTSGLPHGIVPPGGAIYSRSHIRLIAEAAAQMPEGVGPAGNWMIDLHHKFD